MLTDEQLDANLTDLRLSVARCARQASEGRRVGAYARLVLVYLCRWLTKQEGSEGELLITLWSRGLGGRMEIVERRWQMILDRLDAMWAGHQEDEKFPWFKVTNAVEEKNWSRGMMTMAIEDVQRLMDREGGGEMKQIEEDRLSDIYRWLTDCRKTVDSMNRYGLALSVCGRKGKQWSGEWAQIISALCSILIQPPHQPSAIIDPRLLQLLQMDRRANGWRLQAPLGERRAEELMEGAKRIGGKLIDRWGIEYLQALAASHHCYLEYQPELASELEGNGWKEKMIFLEMVIKTTSASIY